MKQRGAFTLIELLIVVAIIAILAAIALPNFLEAQVRSKVAAARSNLRTCITGLESYRVDYNAYPPTVSEIPDDPLAVMAAVQLRRITTPISYIGPSAFRDPFGGPQLYSQLQQIPAANPGLVPPNGFMENDAHSVIYVHYPSTAARFADPRLLVHCVALSSIGPDREDSLGCFSLLPEDLFQQHFAYIPNAHPVSTIYDPTNGSVSAGDVVAWSGSRPGG